METNELTKICTICHIELPATSEYWHKQPNGKYGLRAICKKCVSDMQKIYRSTPESKEKHRLKMIEYRAKHPEKTKSANKKAWDLHKEKYNEIRRIKLKTDPEYRQKRIDSDRRYSASGRRYEMNCKPECREKSRLRSRKRRTIPELKIHDYARNKVWREANSEIINEKARQERELLAPHYIAASMRISMKDLTPDILETKQLIIKIKREIKKSNNIKIG